MFLNKNTVVIVSTADTGSIVYEITDFWFVVKNGKSSIFIPFRYFFPFRYDQMVFIELIHARSSFSLLWKMNEN